MATQRLFVALSPSHATVERLSGIITELRRSRADVRWEDPAKFHLTLKFIGDTPEENIGELLTILGRIAESTDPVVITFDQLGVFPNAFRPRVIWTGAAAGIADLLDLHNLIDSTLAPLGFPADEKPFRPHLTLGKIKSDKNVVQLLETLKSVTLQCGPEKVENLEVIRSILQPHGSTYTTLRSFSFRSSAPHRK